MSKEQWLGPFRAERARVSLYKKAWRQARLKAPDLSFSTWVRRVLDAAAGVDSDGA